MGKVFFNSILTKGVGAVLEVVLQVIILRFLQVEGYGSYGYYVGLADMGFWIFFSAIAKCNIFYCSQKKNSIIEFRKKYYTRYIIPILIICSVASFALGDRLLTLSVLILLMELLVLDKSSQLLANERYNLSLLGEYCLGRVFLVIGTIVLGVAGILTLERLLIMFLLQYLIVYLIFVFCGKVVIDAKETAVSLKKVAVYQYGDILVGLIQKSPVILEYLFTGAFQAGFVTLISLVRTLVAFVSGPTSKVFMPSFAKYYQSGEKEKIADLFHKVMILQMIFLTAVGVVLLGFSELVLQIFSEELIDYATVFAGVSACFLVALSFGPCSSLMQMTGNEKKDITIRSLSVVLMILVWIITRKNEMFILFGIGCQILSENITDYCVVSRILGKMPVGFFRYLVLWIPTILVVALVRVFQLPQNIVVMLVAVVLAVLAYCVIQLANKQVRVWLKEEVHVGIIKK